jgi:ring-1,2-phenylacetyl-CoA epoxidase subunit PaaD
MLASQTPFQTPEPLERIGGPGQEQPDSMRQLSELVHSLPDPEIPVITLGDLGIVREVRLGPSGPVISLTPTYSGCPATEAIRDTVISTVRDAGFGEAQVNIVLAPAWSSSWISPAGRQKLREYGIAPPLDDDERETRRQDASEGARATAQVIRFHRKPQLQCPRCSSPQTELLSDYGSTPCKALYRCLACREPFDYFKPY